MAPPSPPSPNSTPSRHRVGTATTFLAYLALLWIVVSCLHKYAILLRIISKPCALRIAAGLPRFTMGSPLRSTRHDAYTLSSSPGLPPLHQLKSQVPEDPPVRSDSAAMTMPDHASRHFTAASSFLRQEPSAIDLTTPCKTPIESPALQYDEDVTVISIATLTSKPKRKRGAKVLEKKANAPPPRSVKAAEAGPSRKKDVKSKGTAEKSESMSKTTKAKATKKKGGVKSRHFAKLKTGNGETEEVKAPSPPKQDPYEPLELEAALRRRMDWTPPPVDNGQTAGSKSSLASDLLSSAAKSPNREAPKETFESLLKNYSRANENTPKRPSAEPLGGESPVLKKRKMIETVSVKDSSKMPPPTKSVTKAKAPRKKPRTITELATAAYEVPDATEPDTAPTLPQESVQDEGEAAQLKGKKRASKAKKAKKVPPPEPVLLSPTAALRQAANQDYVFGTSSQLAREHSPTFLRDLQSALQASNSLTEEDRFVTPVNSDAIEPEPKQKLWDIGARDEDGRLLDLEVINLADTPQAVPSPAAGLNPFGYAGVENLGPPLPAHIPSDLSFPDIEDLLSKAPEGNDSAERKQAAPLPAHIPSDVSFPDIDDLLGDRVGDIVRGEQQAVSAFVSSAREARTVSDTAPVVLISSGSGPDVETDPELPPARLASASENEVTKYAAEKAVAKPAPEIPKPDFTLYTDIQLSREIASYGFKPVKRRQAMLALLDQCWTSKQRTAPASLPTSHPASTASKAQAITSKPPKSVAKTSPNRPRGRPRKNIEAELSSSEPPPSAQPPPPSPKRGRGRPKKNTEPTAAASSMSTTARTGKAKASTVAPMGPKVVSPPRKAKASAVIEIPDSASDGSLSPSPSACSSPEPMFSPPPEDVSVSIGDDTEMSLVASSTTSDPAALFVHITTAVTSATRTTDAKKPSFHEMMLMYDPIVLEDLAAWLNTGQLSRVGYDGEVSASEVKQWCESKSVCCLWRESLRGTERKRY
ncbi:Structure-specific endonuclease subunit SLX4 [Colletotrichum tanaceti]|uniref:Structure-specific endonuclease subunit SLX4 n=1 Tax=Colletotrichum tanaceti TaxID=1306861 RepID=A0A4V6DHW7_9PEZI|nr:Structure-specific endonuclease subunit SLX4 [Colletotrichum tanaceti]